MNAKTLSQTTRVLAARSSRRDFLRGTSLFSVAAVLPSFLSPEARAATYATSSDKTDDLIYMSATKLAQLIREKKISATEAVQAFIKRQESVNDRLNAVVMNCYERALI